MNRVVLGILCFLAGVFFTMILSINTMNKLIEKNEKLEKKLVKLDKANYKCTLIKRNYHLNVEEYREK